MPTVTQKQFISAYVNSQPLGADFVSPTAAAQKLFDKLDGLVSTFEGTPKRDWQLDLGAAFGPYIPSLDSASRVPCLLYTSRCV